MQKCWKGQVAVGTLEIWRCNRPFPSLQELMVSAMSRPRAREDTTVMMSPSSASTVAQVLFLCPHSPLYKHPSMPTLLLEEPSNVKNSSGTTGVAKASLPPELWECFVFHHTSKVMTVLQVVCITDFTLAPAFGFYN